MTLELWLWTIAACALAIFCILGYALSRASGLWRIDVEAAALRGQATPLAALFTASGRALPLFVIALVTLVIAAITRADVWITVAILAAQVLSQGVVELIKSVLARRRPDAWLIRQELGFSYPSGHATTAIVFFASCAAFALISPWPETMKITAAVLLAIWMAGIGWSRMALGAHYPTDVLGGTLFGVAWSCMLWALLLHFGALPLK